MSTIRAPSPLGTRVAELLWLRSMTLSRHTYLRAARDDRTVTYGELRAVVERWAALLDDLDVGPGSTVGVAVGDPIDFSFVFLGALAAGRTVAPLDPGAPHAELAATCARVVPRIVVSDRPAPAERVAEWVGMPAGTFDLSDGCGVVRQLDRPSQTGAVVLSTSGTTGAAKVVRLEDKRLLHTARAVAAVHHLSAADRGFNPLPLFHVNAEVVGLLATLVSGSTLVLDDRFHRRGFWEVIARHRVTWINAVPAILAHLATLEAGEEVPSGVRFARSASAPLPRPVLERFERTTGIPVVETYGMTEAASQIAANPLNGARKPGSVGTPVATEVRVVGDGPGPGHVQIRGGGVIEGYANDGHEDRFDRAGWLETGDLGYLDADGYLFLVGRVDDVINRGGEKVHPTEVEDVVLAEPGVRAVAVVGCPHHALGQVPVAYLELDGDAVAAVGMETLVSRVDERCAEMLSRAKRPIAYHVVDLLPRGPTGKVRRRAVPGSPALYSLLVR